MGRLCTTHHWQMFCWCKGSDGPRKPQVTHSQRLKTNIEENKSVKSYFTCSLSSLLGFWVVLEPFHCGKKTPAKTTQKPRRDDSEQVKYDLTVSFSSIFVFKGYLWVNEAGFILQTKWGNPTLSLEGFETKQEAKVKVKVKIQQHWVFLITTSVQRHCWVSTIPRAPTCLRPLLALLGPRLGYINTGYALMLHRSTQIIIIIIIIIIITIIIIIFKNI